MNILTAKRLSIALLACATAAPVMADSAVKINAANERVRSGDYAQAIKDYSEIPPDEQSQDEVNYNLGVAQYRQGDLSTAKALFSEASTATTSSLAAAARYNLGNCFYADAVASAETNKQAAIESLDQAISHYRSSLRADPNHVDARANIELAVELRKKLAEELKQEQEQQQQEQQKQDQKQEQNSSEQQEQQQDSKSQQDQENKDSQSQSGESKENEDQQKSDSQSEKNGSESEQSEQSEQKPSDNADQASDGEQSEENEQPDQSQASDQPAQDRQSQSADNQQSTREPSAAEQAAADQAAAEEAESSSQEAEAAPSGQLTPANEQQDREETSGSVAIQNDENSLMTKEEALKMLQAVRDRDMLRRLRQEQTERSRHVPTDRDW